MNVRAMLEELQRLGVELRVAGDDLEYEGPEEAITPDLLERLKVHKADLVVVCRKPRRVTEEDRNSSEAMYIQVAADPEARKLLSAGWKPKERGELVIWANPETGFYYSQEVALHFLESGIPNIRHKSGANGRR